MNCQEKADHSRVLHKEDVDIVGVIRSLTEQFDIIFGKPERVTECCLELERALSIPPSLVDIERLSSLLPILTEHSGPLVFPLYDIIERAAVSCSNPWPLLKGMIAARDKLLVQRALQCVLRCIENGSLNADRDVVGYLAELLDLPGKCIGDPDCLPLVGSVVRSMRISGQERATDPVRAMFLEEREGKMRRLAARLLDITGAPISMELAEKALGEDAFAFLAPYLAYTRASHTDVLSLIPAPGVPPPALQSLRQAHAGVGENLLRHIVAEAGWPQLNLSIEIRHYVRVTPKESLPLMLLPAEARLARSCGDIGRIADLYVAIAHGGSVTESSPAKAKVDPASRFRNYNLAHADILADFLAVAPLTAERIHSILERMDCIIGEFIGLFSTMSEECSVLTSVYEGIKHEILDGLSRHRNGGPLPPDLTRLTMMFEDPQSLGQVRTLHGLKRYLHQKGLQLGFKLVQRSLATNRTVTLFLCSRKKILQKVEGIRYADFESESDGTAFSGRLPYSVALVAEGFVRQLLYGHNSYPRVDAFCYGNEIHYFLSFRNHPAFLRINYSPPLQGGMIDLEYYGVSKYELSVHPDFSLDALQRFFTSLGFYIQVENTRVHARYDKEHTPELKSICEKAEALFCLVPYLLDIDWTIGGLNLDGEARQKVASAWAESFAAWGVLPFRLLLTKDRRGIIAKVIDTPAGMRDVEWSGKGAYTDRFSAGAGEMFRKLVAVAEDLDPEIARTKTAGGRDRVGQIHLERSLLLPLRKALARGELRETSNGFERTAPDVFHRVSEPERFAELIASEDQSLTSAATLAYLIAPLERFLSFRSVGSVGDYEVQSARLSLLDEDLGIHVMRGEKNSACLAFYTHGTVLYRRRDNAADSWECNATCDATTLIALLRRTNYPVPGLEQLPTGLPEEVCRIRESLARALPAQPRRPIPGERAVAGLRATPGRAVGRALFGTEGRKPEDFTGAVLVTAALRPHDGPFLHRAAGVVSTGGGILSHAALLAAQFQKPAVIIAGQWEADPNRAPLLHYVSTEYELEEQESHGYHICARKQIRECELVLREGDLVVIDAKEDLLRVLGQDPDALALHEGFRQWDRATRDMAQATSDHDILLFRGRRIRARHQIEKILTRLADPILTCHALDELLEDSDGLGRSVDAGEKGQLLNVILDNTRVAGTARSHLRWVVRDLRQHYERALRNARNQIPISRYIHEVLTLRLDALRAYQSLSEVGSCLKECGFDGIVTGSSWIYEIDESTRRRLTQLRDGVVTALESLDYRIEDARSRHLLRQWERIESLVDASEEEKRPLDAFRVRLSRSDTATVRRFSARTVLWPTEGGFELSPSIGWKAANLAEVGKIAGELLVPPWFVVTDCAFRQILQSPSDQIFRGGMELPGRASSLGKAIEVVLGLSRLDRFQKSSLIQNLWDSVILPETLAEEVVSAYRRIGQQESPTPQREAGRPEPLVALRSSSCEEDAENAARAGEFDTFLYIHGEQALLKYLLRTWSGLWSDRALHTREMLGTMTSFAGGGVIVQRIVNSRVSGVLQTINVAQTEFREIVINAGWGLGEGIVSGTVAADQIIVSKEGDLEKGPFPFSYVTADKKEHVVFNSRAGCGTIRCDAPYHQRLRPALEYSELCELVAVAVRLESIYGYPLDIEFGIEESRLWILQVRPVPTSLSLLERTLQNSPVSRARGEFHAFP
jgi:phosphohistidine swiveling domain-containing protein